MLSRKMMRYWANFARTGYVTLRASPAANRVGCSGMEASPLFPFTPRDPNGGGLPLWPVYDQMEQYLQLDLNLSVGQRLKEQDVEFWTKTVPLTMSTSGVLHSPLSSLIFLSLFLPFFFSFAP